MLDKKPYKYCKSCVHYDDAHCVGCREHTFSEPSLYVKKICMNCKYRSTMIGGCKIGSKEACINTSYCNWEPMEQERVDYTNIVRQAYVNSPRPVCKEISTQMNRIFPDVTLLDIKKVIFNNPATIVLWEDGTKTVVKCDGEKFDQEKGLAMAISKKAMGNTGRYFETFKKWVKEDDKCNFDNWNESAKKNLFCIENDCPYYFPEIEQCMYGEDDIPNNLGKKCTGKERCK